MILPLIAFLIFPGTYMLQAQEAATAEELLQAEENLEQIEESTQEELPSEFEDVRDAADAAFEELDAEFVDDSGDTTVIYDLTEEPADSSEAESADADSLDAPAFYEYGYEEVQDTTYLYETDTDFTVYEQPQRTYHNQKITDRTDKAYVVFSRLHRKADYALMNPANIGVKSRTLWGLGLPGVPFPNLGLSVQNSSFSIGTINTYFNDGRLLTEEELDEFVGLFYEDGLNLKLNVSLPSLFTLRFPVGYGSAFINTGVVVEQDGTLPGEVLAIPFKGIRFNDPIYTENLDMVIGTYLKTNVGYGTNIPISEYGNLRVGASMNFYAGSFASVNTKHMSIVSTPDSISISGNAITTMVDYGDPDPGEIISFSPGFDVGVGFHFRLGEMLGLFDNFSNDLDVQIGLQDLNAKLSSGDMIRKYYSISGSLSSLDDASDSDALDSLLIQEEFVEDSAYVDEYDIASRANIMLSYQPFSFLMLQAGATSFLTEGLGYDENLHYSMKAHLFPLTWLNLNAGLQKTYNDQMFYSAGIGFLFNVYEFSLDTYFIGGTGEDIQGLGFNIRNNFYF